MPALGALDGRAWSTLAPPERREGFEGMRAGAIASVHSWELVTAVDGPGTRLTTFLAGCPLRCQYCQNPDTVSISAGHVETFDEVMERIRHYRAVFRATGGGVTMSGGEPLLQAAFVERAFIACRELGIPTALDTSGFLGRRASDAMLDATSLVLLDVKSGIPEVYRTVTSRPLEPTLEFGDRLAARAVTTWVRFVLVPGLTDAVANVEAVADIVERWGNVDRVEVLPFHQLGAHKWHDLGRHYELEGLRPPDEALQTRVRDQFAARGLTVY